MPKRNLLLLMEPTLSGQLARQLACTIAARGSCALSALHITEPNWPADEDRKSSLSTNLVQALQALTNDTSTVTDEDELLAQHKICYVEKTMSGPKYALLSQEAEQNDLILLGREGNFEEQSEHAKEVINLMLEYRPRPMVIASPEAGTGEEVLVAYDGDPRSSRAVQLFVLLGLAAEKQLHLLCIDRQQKAAQSKIDSITSFLHQHEVEATSEIIESRDSPTEILFERINQARPSMVVAGAKGTTGWRQTMFGSTGDYLIRHCPVPLFTSP